MYYNYKYLQPPVTQQSKVIQATLDFLKVKKYSIVYEMHKENEKLAQEGFSPDTNRNGYVFVTPLVSKGKYADFTTLVVQVTEVLTKIKIQEIKVIVLTCGEELVRTVFKIATKLGMVSEDFLWIGTEAVIQALNVTNDRHQDMPIGISNLIGVKLNMSEETIGKKQ